jgi:heme-degrading monooxygenase HmoA
MNTESPHFHLAQVNIGRIRGPLDGPIMHGFVSQLERLNALAEASPGFVWRLQTEDGDATAIRPYDDDRILVNMSVWESREALQNYVYSSDHVNLLRARREWFEPMEGPILALWWIPAGHTPTVEEAKARLQLLAKGPSPDAFTFRQSFPPPGQSGPPAPELDAEFCTPA